MVPGGQSLAIGMVVCLGVETDVPVFASLGQSLAGVEPRKMFSLRMAPFSTAAPARGFKTLEASPRARVTCESNRGVYGFTPPFVLRASRASEKMRPPIHACMGRQESGVCRESQACMNAHCCPPCMRRAVAPPLPPTHRSADQFGAAGRVVDSAHPIRVTAEHMELRVRWGGSVMMSERCAPTWSDR